MSITLNDTIGSSYPTDPEDVWTVKSALSDLGYYEAPATYGMTPWPDTPMFKSIKSFQKDHGLEVDGIMKPEGPTLATMNRRLAQAEKSSSDGNPSMPSGGVLGDFLRNYHDMREANTIGADKYFHCKANCESTQRGPLSEGTAEGLSNLREWFDQTVKGDPAWASEEDQQANLYGCQAGRQWPNQSCGKSCDRYRPRGLPQRY